MKKKLLHTIDDYAGSILCYSRSISATFSKEAIHDLRTTFKKLRALLRWQKVNPKKWQSFKPIYHGAGQLRNLQLAGRWPGKRKMPESFDQWLSKITKAARKEWNELDNKRQLIDWKEKIKKTKIKGIANKAFLFKKLHSIRLLLHTGTVTDTSLHEIRKNAKDLLYVLKFAKNKLPKLQAPIILKIPLTKISDTIGKYNDMRTLLSLLAAYARTRKKTGIIDNIKKRVLLQKKDEKKKLIFFLRKYPWIIKGG